MAKRLVDIDDELLESARVELNTNGITDTVRAALTLAATRSARIGQVDWLRSGGMAEMADRDIRDRAWRS